MAKLDLRHSKFLEMLETNQNDALLYAADCLQNSPSPKFINLLVSMLEAEHERWSFFVHGSAGRKQADAITIGRYMYSRIECEGIKTEAVVAEAKERFGVGRSTALAALKDWREHLEYMGELQREHSG